MLHILITENWLFKEKLNYGLINAASGLLIGNKPYSEISHAAIWTKTMDMYSSDVAEVWNLFPECLIQHHTG